MGYHGTCECCDRSGLNLPAKGLCGKCYAAHRAGKIFWSDAHQQWLARIEADADRYNCVWMGDQALEPEEFEPVGNGEFAQAGAAEAAEAGADATPVLPGHADPDMEVEGATAHDMAEDDAA